MSVPGNAPGSRQAGRPALLFKENTDSVKAARTGTAGRHVIVLAVTADGPMRKDYGT